MKSPIRYTKTTATKAVSLKKPAPEIRDPNAPIPKLAVANMPYNASDKRAINKSNAPKEASDQQAAAKKKQAAAQES